MLRERPRGVAHQVASQAELRRARRKKTRRKERSVGQEKEKEKEKQQQQQQQQQQQPPPLPQEAKTMDTSNAMDGKEDEEVDNSPVHREKATCAAGAGQCRPPPRWLLILSLAVMMILHSPGRDSPPSVWSAAAAAAADLSKLNATTTTTRMEKTANETSSGNKSWPAGNLQRANNVVCNSRARCLLLEYMDGAPVAARSPAGAQNATEALLEFTADYEAGADDDADDDNNNNNNNNNNDQPSAAELAAEPDAAPPTPSEAPAGSGPRANQSSAAAGSAWTQGGRPATTQSGADQSKSGRQSGRAGDHKGDVLTATNPSQQQQREAGAKRTGPAAAQQQDGARLHSANATTPTTATATATAPLDHRRPLSSFRNNHNNHHHHHHRQPLEQRHHQITGAGHLFALPSGHPQEQPAPQPNHHQQAASDQYRQTATGPQLYAQSLYSNSAPKLSFHAHSPHYLPSESSDGQLSPSALESALVTPSGAPKGRTRAAAAAASRSGSAVHLLDAVTPLKSLALANGSLTGDQQQPMAGQVRQMLDDIACQGVQSLDLSGNRLQFELFTELYSLLIIPMRSHLFHLNLAHNSLAKLGVTFTGFIEHSLILAAHHQHKNNNNHNNNNNYNNQSASIRWPFAANNSTATPSNYNSTQQNELTSTPSRLKPSRNASNNSNSNNNNNNKYSPSASLNSYRPQPRLGDGHLFNVVVSQISANNESVAADQCKHLMGSYLANHTLMSSMMHQFALIRGLDLSHNKLKWLINDQFRTLKYVQSIRLDHNRLRYIHQQAFNGLESLKYLNLNHNRLQTIYVEQFQTNYNLLALMLRANYLAYLRAGSFAALNNLRRLDLSQNKFTISSNNALVGLESLRLLNFSSNQFIHAPSAALHPLVSLERLDLSSNQIAQLTPGSFFHLPIEELWLDANNQLAAVDRGAFWDLPYLRQLHLRWNPMLASINSQAFVGTQNLQLIEVEGSTALDGAARQMLENITIATTSRQLRVEQEQQQQQQQQSTTKPPNINININNNNNTSTPSPVLVVVVSANSNNTPASNQTSGRQQTQIGLLVGNQMALNEQQQTKQSLKSRPDNHLRQYAYSLGLLTLLVAALKLVFKYTSTSHYLEARRRAKRVYEVRPSQGGGGGGGDDDDNDDYHLDGASGGPIQMQLRTCERHFFRGAGPAAGGGARRRLDQVNDDDESCSVVSNSDGSSATSSVSNQYHVIDANNQASGCSASASSSSSSSSSSPPPSSILSEPNEVDPNDSEKQESTRNRPSDEDGFEEIDLRDDERQPRAEGDDHVMQEQTTTSNIDVVYCPECPQVAAATTITGFNDNQQQQQQQQQQTDSQTGNDCCDSLLMNPTGGAGDLGPVDVGGEQRQQILGQEQQVNNGGGASGTALDLIHSQLVAAGFDYGHANCLHFYQSLGPALQFADLTANFVNQMDYY